GWCTGDVAARAGVRHRAPLGDLTRAAGYESELAWVRRRAAVVEALTLPSRAQPLDLALLALGGRLSAQVQRHDAIAEIQGSDAVFIGAAATRAQQLGSGSPLPAKRLGRCFWDALGRAFLRRAGLLEQAPSGGQLDASPHRSHCDDVDLVLVFTERLGQKPGAGAHQADMHQARGDQGPCPAPSHDPSPLWRRFMSRTSARTGAGRSAPVPNARRRYPRGFASWVHFEVPAFRSRPSASNR